MTRFPVAGPKRLSLLFLKERNAVLVPDRGQLDSLQLGEDNLREVTNERAVLQVSGICAVQVLKDHVKVRLSVGDDENSSRKDPQEEVDLLHPLLPSKVGPPTESENETNGREEGSRLKSRPVLLRFP